MTARDRAPRQPGRAARAVCAALAIGAASVAGAPSPQAQIMRARTMEDDAALFFGPPPSPYYDAAEAIQSGKPIGAAALAGVKPDIDRRFQEGDFTLLNFAWRVGNVEAIEQLVEHGSDWRQPSMTHGPMAMQDLVYQVQTDDSPKAAATLAVLLRHGLDPNMRERHGDHAPILLAPISLHNRAVFKMLVQAGADPWARTEGKFDRSDAIETALDSGEQDFVISLVANGAFDHRPPSDVRVVLEALARKPRDQAPEWQENQRVARAIVDRLRLTPSPDVKSMGRTGGSRSPPQASSPDRTCSPRC